MLAILLASIPYAATAQDDARETMARAELAFERGDITNAMALYREVAQQAQPRAQARLAYLLDLAEMNEEAVYWYEQAAAAGLAEAEYGLAVMLSSGETERDHERAVQLLQSAAGRQHAPSIRVLAAAYESGELSLIPDYDAAVGWLRAGVAAGDVWSMTRLSRAYESGELGLRTDLQQAQQLANRAAAQRPNSE